MKLKLMPPNELPIFEKAASEATVTFEHAKKTLGPAPVSPRAEAPE